MNKAQKVAIEAAHACGIDANAVTRVFDTDFAERFPCWRVNDSIVVYEDEPDTIVSIGARPGRLVVA